MTETRADPVNQVVLDRAVMLAMLHFPQFLPRQHPLGLVRTLSKAFRVLHRFLEQQHELANLHLVLFQASKEESRFSIITEVNSHQELCKLVKVLTQLQ